MRVKCRVRPEKEGMLDNQVSPGKFYDVVSLQERFGQIYYTVVGDDGIEIERPAQFFTRPLSKRKRVVKTSDGRFVSVENKGTRGVGKLLSGRCVSCRRNQ